jgi:hypothetical protein
MKIQIAIMAACLGTLAFVPADFAQAENAKLKVSTRPSQSPAVASRSQKQDVGSGKESATGPAEDISIRKTPTNIKWGTRSTH